MSPNELVPYASVLAIAGMAAMTYLMRVGGYWLMGHVPITARMRRMLEALPGAVVVAIVLPVMVKSGLPAMLAVAAVVASMIVRPNEFIAMAVGLAVVTAVRAVGL
jgi:uncharacterized membrane protein